MHVIKCLTNIFCCWSIRTHWLNPKFRTWPAWSLLFCTIRNSWHLGDCLTKKKALGRKSMSIVTHLYPPMTTKARISKNLKIILVQKYGLKYCVGFKTGNDQSVFPPSSLRSLRHLQTSTGSDLLFALSCLHGLAFWLERDRKKERGRQRERDSLQAHVKQCHR